MLTGDARDGRLRVMLDPHAPPPPGWEARRTVEEFAAALADADPTVMAAVAIKGTLEEAWHAFAAVIRARHGWFHLLGGMEVQIATHFHDPELGMAVTHRSAALKRHGGGPETDTHVPLGGDVIWQRDLGRILIPGQHLPETTRSALIGQPLARLLDSHMAPGDLMVTGFEDGPLGPIALVLPGRDLPTNRS